MGRVKSMNVCGKKIKVMYLRLVKIPFKYNILVNFGIFVLCGYLCRDLLSSEIVMQKTIIWYVDVFDDNGQTDTCIITIGVSIATFYVSKKVQLRVHRHSCEIVSTKLLLFTK